MSRSARTAGLALAAILLGHSTSSLGKPSSPPITAQKHHKKRRPPAAPAAPAPAPAPPAAPLRAPPLSVERFSLDNGLRVVLCPVPDATSAVVTVLYDAGAHREPRGAGGLANLVRASMGLGSANLLRGEHDRHLAGRGARWWSELSSERVAYTSVLPPGELALGLWLEADRLKSLQLKPDGVLAQRELLVVELQKRSTEPRDVGDARLRALVFQSLWPYEHAARGTATELAALRPEAAQGFYDAFYTASNAVLVVAGAIDTEAASQLVHRFFETARRQDRPTPTTAQLSEQTSQRAARVEEPQLQAPVLLYGWPTPGRRTDDAIAVEAALHALAYQRLPARLQQERGLASQITLTLEDQRPAGLASLTLHLADDAARADAERAVDAELESLAQKGPSEAELASFRVFAETQSWRTFAEVPRLALRLGEMELLHGDAGLLAGEIPRVAALNREQVRAAAARYLSQARRSYILLDVPGSKKTSPPLQAAPPPSHGHGKPHRPPAHRPPAHRPPRPRPAR